MILLDVQLLKQQKQQTINKSIHNFAMLSSISIKSKIISILRQDNSITIFYFFQFVIDILLIAFYRDQEIFSIIICLLNGILAIQHNLLPKEKALFYQQICQFFSKLTTIFIILFIDNQLTILIIIVFERLSLKESDSRILRKFDNLVLKIITLIIMLFNFNLTLTISISYCILIEINNLLLQNYSPIIPNKETFSGLLTQLDSRWVSRLQIIPSCYIIINPQSLTVTYKNQHTFNYFFQCYQDEKDLDDLILHKLQISLVQEKIDQIKQFSDKKQFNKKLTGRFNRWQFKSDSVSLQLSPASNREQLKQNDSLDFQSSSKVSLSDIIQNKKFGEINFLKAKKVVDIFCDQNYPQSNNLLSMKKIELFGSIINNSQDNEIIVILNETSKQNELFQLMSNDEFKSKIIESFSHELRTPLNSALNFLTSSLQDEDTPKTVKEELILPTINSLKMQQYFINDIIDLSQIYANNFSIQVQEFSLRELITEITNIFKMQFEMKELELYVDLQENVMTTIAADYSRLNQVLVNLLQNSLKFSLSGLIVLKIASSSNDSLKITVRDQGVGIDSDHLLQLQFLLQNIEQNKDIQINRTWQGFGLLISAILVNKLAPRDSHIILINSEGLNCGTEVTFYLENHMVKYNQQRKFTIRQSIQRFQSSNDESILADINGLIFQATDHISKQFFTEFSGKRNFRSNQMLKTETLKLNDNTNDNNGFSESQSFETLQQKYGQLSPLAPSLITDKLLKFPIVQYTKLLSIDKVLMPEGKEDEEFLQIFQRNKKCSCSNILSVDDEIFNQRSLQILLSKFGFNVLLAFNGEQAIKRILEIEPCHPQCQLASLILMDYQMPIMDGLTATKKLIEMMNQNKIPKIHIIGLTAFTNASDITNCLKAGMSDVLAKPLNLKGLREILTLI